MKNLIKMQFNRLFDMKSNGCRCYDNYLNYFLKFYGYYSNYNGKLCVRKKCTTFMEINLLRSAKALTAEGI